MVVLVLMTSCHVSENPKNGPDMAQSTTPATQIRNATGLPAARAARLANAAKILSNCMVRHRLLE